MAAVQTYNRNPWSLSNLALLPRTPERWYAQDFLWTFNSHDFMDDPRFQRAYARGARAAGRDPRIHWRVHTILWAATLAVSRPGAFVECGTGRGIMASAICEYLGWHGRDFYLLDTFLPFWTNRDGDQLAGGPVSDAYAIDVDHTRANFSEWDGVHMVQGRIPESLSSVKVDQVAFLHIDMNHPSPETAALRHFWPLVSSGGVVVLDDYGFAAHRVQRQAIDVVAREFDMNILALPTGQGVIVKS